LFWATALDRRLSCTFLKRKTGCSPWLTERAAPGPVEPRRPPFDRSTAPDSPMFIWEKTAKNARGNRARIRKLDQGAAYVGAVRCAGRVVRCHRRNSTHNKHTLVAPIESGFFAFLQSYSVKEGGESGKTPGKELLRPPAGAKTQLFWRFSYQ